MTSDNPFRNGDIAEIKERLASIEVNIEFMRSYIHNMKLPGEGTICVFEKGRLDRLETTVSKHGFVSAVLGVIGGIIVLFINVVFRK